MIISSFIKFSFISFIIFIAIQNIIDPYADFILDDEDEGLLEDLAGGRKRRRTKRRRRRKSRKKRRKSRKRRKRRRSRKRRR